MNLATQLKNLDFKILTKQDQRQLVSRFRDRLSQGRLTRDENPLSHFCVFFLPVDSKRRKIMLGDHIKAATWISPGGHVDEGEGLMQTVLREIEEELGVKPKKSEIRGPVYFTIKDVSQGKHGCQWHYDIWYLFDTNGKDFKVDMSEYHAVKWVSLKEAMAMLTDESNIQALRGIKKLFLKNN